MELHVRHKHSLQTPNQKSVSMALNIWRERCLCRLIVEIIFVCVLSLARRGVSPKLEHKDIYQNLSAQLLRYVDDNQNLESNRKVNCGYGGFMQDMGEE